jgi:hypothetical protein
MKLQEWPIDRPKPYERNARNIPPSAVATVAASLKEFGWQQPIVVDKAGVIIVGHTRLQAAKSLGFKEVPVQVADHLTPAQVRAYRIMDNRSHDETSWNTETLSLELKDLKMSDFDMSLTGFEASELDDFLSADFTVATTETGGEQQHGSDRDAGDDDPDSEREPDEEAILDEVSQPAAGGCSDASLLKKLNITVADPQNEVVPGDVWKLGNHILICGSVIAGWQQWLKYLDTPETLFCPFPGPFVPLSEKAAKFRLVLVQPDPYIAGHILDRYIEGNGKDGVKKAASK